MQKCVTRLLTSAVVISLLGFFDAIYLLYSDIAGVFICPLEGGIFQCEIVHASPYSRFLGVHVSLWGVIFYLTLITILLLSLKNKNPYWLGFFLPLLGFIGLGFSIYLTSMEIFVITYFCEFCLFSALCSVVIFILILITKKLSQRSLFNYLSFWKMFNKET